MGDVGGSVSRLLIQGGEIVDSSGRRRADVLLEGGRIVAVGPELEAAGAESIDATGALVVPGAIDVHTHFDLPVGEVRSADDFESGTIAAACGGTTCVVDFAGAGREGPDEALRSWHEKAHDRAAVDYGFHLTVTAVPQDPAEAARLFLGFLEQGIASVKLYMAYPDRVMVDDATLGRALAASERTGVLVCVHAEDGDEVERRKTREIEQGHLHPRAHPDSRPPEVEAEAIRRAADLAGRAGAPLYVVHLSSRSGHAEVLAANRRGSRVFAETCPQYLFLTAERLSGEPATAASFMCAPPLRSDTDREALWSGLSGGSIQVVATDHCPFTLADRHRGVRGHARGWRDFTEIPGGLPGVETRLSLLYQGVRSGALSLERWIAVAAGAPARLFGLAHVKGSIAPGLDADIVVFDPDARKRLDAHRLHMRSDHSPYEGMEVIGWPAVTIARGRIVARDGEPADLAPGWGRFVPRRPYGWTGRAGPDDRKPDLD